MSTIVESVTVLAVVDATVGSFEAVVCGAVVVTGTIGWLRVVCCGMCMQQPRARRGPQHQQAGRRLRALGNTNGTGCCTHL